MPIAQGRLHAGKSYRIEFVSDASTTDPSLLERGWVPKSGAPQPPDPLTLRADPGSGDHDAGTVPVCHALDLQWDVPDNAKSKVSVRVIEDGQEVVKQDATQDGWLTIIVRTT